MARTVTRGQLRTWARQKANVEQSLFVTDSEVNDYINFSVSQLWGETLTADPSTNRKTTTLTIVAGTDTYSLPSDFWRALGLDYQVASVSPATWLDVRRIPFTERNRFSTVTVATVPGLVPFRYYLTGVAGSMSVTFVPPPTAGSTVRVWYLPAAPTFTSDADTLDGINGLEELVVLDVAIQILQKEDTDTSPLERKKMEILARLRSEAADRDGSEPERVSDVGVNQGWDATPGEWW